jgi:hypothetical protein
MAKSYLRGHEIEFLEGKWVYSDTKESTVETHKERPCGHCNLYSTEEGHDSCLGTLIGLMNACCGHGQSKDAYVQFIDSTTVYKEDAVIIQNILKKWS